MPNKLQMITPSSFLEKVNQKQTFVLNVIASWCSDCTDQQQNILLFAARMSESGVETLQIDVQQQKQVFIDQAHEALVTELGGHGYPRTVLIKKGAIISANNVEIINKKSLLSLATEFKKMLQA